MKVKVLKTTDGKYQGAEFVIPDLSPTSIHTATGKDFDFNKVIYLQDNIVELQSSHYTARIEIIEQ